MKFLFRYFLWMASGCPLYFAGISAGAAAAIGAGVSAAASLGSAMMQSGAASDATNAQVAASQDANKANLEINKQQLDYLKESRDMSRADLEPFRQAGLSASNRLQQLLGLGSGLTAPTKPTLVTVPKITATMTPAQKLATQKQIDAANAQNATLNANYQKSLANYNSQVQAIQKSPSYGSLLKDYGEKFNDTPFRFTADPGYQFRKEQGNRDLQGRLAAMGMTTSGAALKEGMRFNQGLADQTYNDAFQRFQQDRGFRYGAFRDRASDFYGNRSNKFNMLSGIAGSGQATANQIANNNQQYGQSAAAALGQRGQFLQSNYQNIGNANAKNAINQSNVWGNALSGIGQAFSGYAGYKGGGI